MNNYEKIKAMDPEELSVFLCFTFIDGFELLAKEQRISIEKCVRDWLLENYDGGINGKTNR